MLKKAESQVRPMEYPALAEARAAVIDLELPVTLANRVLELESKLEEKERQFTQELESVRRDALEQGKHARTAVEGMKLPGGVVVTPLRQPPCRIA